jgi:hypothetical protein
MLERTNPVDFPHRVLLSAADYALMDPAEDWCIERLGVEGTGWIGYFPTELYPRYNPKKYTYIHNWVFCFKDANEAVLFRLTFADLAGPLPEAKSQRKY